MKRYFGWIVLSTLLAISGAMGCGDDDGGDDTIDAGRDAGRDAARDSSSDANNTDSGEDDASAPDAD